MPFNGSGVFSIVNTFVPGTTIFSSAVNANFTDIATGLSTAVLKNGTQTITDNIPMAGFGFTGVGQLSSQAVITVASNTTTDILSQGSLLIAISGTASITSFGADAAIRRNQIKFVRATGSFTMVNDQTTLILPGGQNIICADGDTFIVISDANSNARIYAFQRGQAIAYAPGFLFGCNLANDAGDLTNDITITSGYAADNTGGAVMVLPSPLIKQLDATWAVGDNAGMLATGVAIANTTYHIFVIRRPDTAVVDVAADTSVSGANIAANTDVAYTQMRRVGSIMRVGGSIVLFTQFGDQFLRSVGVADISAVNPGVSAVTRTLSVPIGIVVQAIVISKVINTGSGGAVVMYLSALVQSDQAPDSGVNFQNALTETVAGGVSQSGAQLTIQTNTSAQIRSRINFSDANVTLGIATIGWIDNRGRFE